MKVYLEITYQTFKDILSSKILYNVIFLGAAILLVTFVSAEFSYGATARVAFDIGLGLVSFCVSIIAILYGASLIPNEIENRTLYMILSRPVSRGMFIFAKFTGLSLVLLINFLILLILVMSLYFIFGGVWNPLITWCVLFVYLEVIMLLSLSVFLSTIVNKVIAILSVITLWISGHGIENLKTFSLIRDDPYLLKIINFMSIYLPNFEKFNIKKFVLNDSNLEQSFLVSNLLYCVLWIMFLAFVSKLTFEKKDLS
jgi:ABC-type transport system involved in multi-copper enzyme maturation permease subunit